MDITHFALDLTGVMLAAGGTGYFVVPFVGGAVAARRQRRHDGYRPGQLETRYEPRALLPSPLAAPRQQPVQAPPPPRPPATPAPAARRRDLPPPSRVAPPVPPPAPAGSVPAAEDWYPLADRVVR